MESISYLFCYVILHAFITMVKADIPSTIGDGQCIWYEECVKNPDKRYLSFNCKYDGPAKMLKENAITELESICPELVEEIREPDGTVKTCCSRKQVSSLKRQLRQMSPLIQNCPACLRNIRKNYCYFTCHPRHSSFIRATEYYEFESKGKNKTAISSVEQYSSKYFIDRAYASCENVYYPPINGPAMVLLCGVWGDQKCTPERLFDYFGNSFLAPFPVTYVYGNENVTVESIDNGTMLDMKPFNAETTPCNTTDPELSCICQDCLESCQAPPQPPMPDNPMTIGELNVYTFLMIVIYCVFAILFVLYASIKGLPGKEETASNYTIFYHKISAKFEKSLQASFRRSSEIVAYYPYLTLAIGAIVIVILSSGITKLKMTTDPVKLWASPDSRTRYEKDYFDKNFGPFYRTNQIIITSVGIDPFNQTLTWPNGIEQTTTFGPVFNATFMRAIMDLQREIMNLRAEFEGETVTMDDICIKPLAPQKNECMIQSVMNYWQNDPELLESQMVNENGEESFQYLTHLKVCLNNPTFMSERLESCMGTYGGPVLPYVALGGFLPEGSTLSTKSVYENATAQIITILGQNYLDSDKLGPAKAWEKVFIEFLKNYSHPLMDFAIYSERGVEDEIIRESKGDVTTILISYLVMFTYVTISLGQPSSECNEILIGTKMTLGLSSVILVFLSVISSIGLCSYLGAEATLFVIEVIPFLLLAIGVDNIYLLVQTWQRTPKEEKETVESHIARCVGSVAPSILLATSSEAICFFLGALSKMPAVHAFALFAGVATSIGFILQITCLVALMVLDARRIEENRYDVLCCVKAPKKVRNSKVKRNVCLNLFDKIYTPVLFKDSVRAAVILIFAAFFTLSAIFVPKVDVGLEQDIGMPSDSYIIKYFDYMADYLSVGSPIYFVVEEGFNFTDIDEQNLICQSPGCNSDGILAQVYWASRAPEITTIATGSNNWLDAYLNWIYDGVDSRKANKACCRLDRQGNFINTSEENALNAKETCLGSDDFTDDHRHRPLPEYFMEYLPDFLRDNPHGIRCPDAGHPTYGMSVVVKEEGCEEGGTCVGASNFMAYHTILKTSKDFTKGLEEAYNLTDQMNKYLSIKSNSSNARVFPYSIFYVYYEQYLTMWHTTAKNLGLSFLTVFLVMIALSGLDAWSAAINLIIITMIVIDVIGAMVFWNIQLNAISLVNLVMAVGISVEFCNHITHAFALSSGSRVERASKALVYTGSSVLSGITITKFGGIIVLAFATSNVITIFYFRMYLLIVLFGSAHGLVFLPVLLSIIGPLPNPYIHPPKNQENESNLKEYSNEAFSQ